MLRRTRRDGGSTGETFQINPSVYRSVIFLVLNFFTSNTMFLEIKFEFLYWVHLLENVTALHTNLLSTDVTQPT